MNKLLTDAELDAIELDIEAERYHWYGIDSVRRLIAALREERVGRTKECVSAADHIHKAWAERDAALAEAARLKREKGELIEAYFPTSNWRGSRD